MATLSNGISLVIITKNEEANLRRCILSCRDVVKEIIIVDDFSTDNTLKTAKESGAVVYQRKLDNFSEQKNFALSKANCEWALFLDADEVIDEALRQQILSITPHPNPLTKGEREKGEGDTDINGYSILRKNFIFGKLLRFGGNGNNRLIRLFKKDKAKFTQPVHEYLVLSGKPQELKKGCILHHSTPDINNYIAKLNLYTSLEAQFIKKRKFIILRIIFAPAVLFIKKFFLQLGFLDGIEGFIFYALSAFYTFIKYSKALINK